MPQHNTPSEHRDPPAFDPSAAASHGSGIFGLPFTREQARVVIIPVPFDATTSYADGAAAGPAAVLDASRQVDLLDRQFARIYQRGLHMLPLDDDAPRTIADLSRRARALAQPIIDAAGATDDDHDALEQIERAGQQVNDYVHAAAERCLADDKAPAVLGGDHSTPYANIRACAQRAGALGVLHFDAHFDLRHAFEGFAWSHASVMHNVLTHVPEVERLVSVAVRDYCEEETDFIDDCNRQRPGRVVPFFDADLHEARARGVSFLDQARRIVDSLPERVYVSFDIDALDPALCPGTGTPVPGGLAFNDAALILKVLKDSGRRVMGFDLVEVRPSSHTDTWNANVGARILYKLCALP